MTDNRLLEITVQADTNDRPDEVALDWVRRLELSDGTRISVVQGHNQTRPRRFIVYNGGVMTPQQYNAVSMMDALEELLRREGRALDAWEVLTVARKTGSPLASLTMATIARAARLLQREGRLQTGPVRGTWMATPAKNVAA